MTRPTGLNSGKPQIPGPTSIIAKPKRKTRAKAKSIRRGQAYKLVKQVGKAFAQDAAARVSLPGFAFPQGQRLSFLDRALDEDTGTLAKDSTFGSRYRSTWDAQDELFSTATTRNFVEGLLNGLPRNQIADDVWQRWARMVDLISALRIPTRYSGFSTSGEVMQHPTAAGEGFFSPLAVAGEHGSYDSERVKYIGRAVQASQSAALSTEEQLRTAMRAAIEFSLNYFTAPVTARNVKPFSTKASVASGDVSLQDQLASRERIKEIYLQLGGNLRDLPTENGKATTETPEQSWDRPWRQGLTTTREEPFPVAPPSPRRSRRDADPNSSSAATATLPVGGSSAPQASASAFGAPAIAPVTSNGYLTGSPFTTMFAGPALSGANMSPLPSFPSFTPLHPFPRFSGSSAITPSTVVASSAVLANDVVQGMTQAVQSVFSTPAPQSVSLPEWQGFSQNTLTDPMELDLPSDWEIDFDYELTATELNEIFTPAIEDDEADLLDSFYSEFSQSLSGAVGSGPSRLADDFSSSSTDALPIDPSMSSGELTITSDMFPPVPTTPLENEQEVIFENLRMPQSAVYDGGELTASMFPSVPTGIPEVSSAAEELGAEAGGEELLALLAL